MGLIVGVTGDSRLVRRRTKSKDHPSKPVGPNLNPTPQTLKSF